VLQQPEVSALDTKLPALSGPAAQAVSELKTVLGQPDHLVYKAEVASIGGSLMEKGDFKKAVGTPHQHPRDPSKSKGYSVVEKTAKDNSFLRNKAIWKTWGKIALFDLVTDNTDRFPFNVEPAKAVPNYENLDFSANDSPIAFDNLNTLSATMTGNDWKCEGAVQQAKEYCYTFAKNISWRWGFLDPKTEAPLDKEAAKFGDHLWSGFKEARAKLKKSKPGIKPAAKKFEKSGDNAAGTALREFHRRVRLL
jgi:hypothetical protein